MEQSRIGKSSEDLICYGISLGRGNTEWAEWRGHGVSVQPHQPLWLWLLGVNSTRLWCPGHQPCWDWAWPELGFHICHSHPTAAAWWLQGKAEQTAGLWVSGNIWYLEELPCWCPESHIVKVWLKYCVVFYKMALLCMLHKNAGKGFPEICLMKMRNILALTGRNAAVESLILCS